MAKTRVNINHTWMSLEWTKLPLDGEPCCRNPGPSLVFSFFLVVVNRSRIYEEIRKIGKYQNPTGNTHFRAKKIIDKFSPIQKGKKEYERLGSDFETSMWDQLLCVSLEALFGRASNISGERR